MQYSLQAQLVLEISSSEEVGMSSIGAKQAHGDKPGDRRVMDDAAASKHGEFAEVLVPELVIHRRRGSVGQCVVREARRLSIELRKKSGGDELSDDAATCEANA